MKVLVKIAQWGWNLSIVWFALGCNAICIKFLGYQWFDVTMPWWSCFALAIIPFTWVSPILVLLTHIWMWLF